MSHLFSPFKIKSLELRNRIAVPPMCQYSAEDGLVNDWHRAHYTSMARGGPGLVIVEATGVSPEGRITPGCLGIWNDEQATRLAEVARLIKAAGAVPGIQIGHAGRKASANLPWEGDNHIPESDPRAWQTISASPIAFGEGLPRVPKEMTSADIARVRADFVAAAKRAKDAGFEWLELHFAHGYLAQNFYSVHSNKRTDQYGGSYEGRRRFLLETLQDVRKAWPEHLPLTARLGVIEYDGRDEEMLSESIKLVKEFREDGLDFLNVSMGFNTPTAKIPWAPGLLLPVAERIRRETGVPVAAAWGIDQPKMTNQAIESGQLDLAMMGRAFLVNPHYAFELAKALDIPNPSSILPSPYAHWVARYQRS